MWMGGCNSGVIDWLRQQKWPIEQAITFNDTILKSLPLKTTVAYSQTLALETIFDQSNNLTFFLVFGRLLLSVHWAGGTF